MFQRWPLNTGLTVYGNKIFSFYIYSSEGSIVGVYILELKATTVQTQNSVLQITVQAVQDVQADAGSSSDLIKAVNTQEIVITAVLGRLDILYPMSININVQTDTGSSPHEQLQSSCPRPVKHLFGPVNFSVFI